MGAWMIQMYVVWMIQEHQSTVLPHQLLQLLPLTRSEGPALAFDHLPCHVSVDEVPQRLLRKEKKGGGSDGGREGVYLSIYANDC